MPTMIFTGWIGMASWIIFGKPKVALYNGCWLFLLGVTLGYAAAISHQ